MPLHYFVKASSAENDDQRWAIQYCAYELAAITGGIRRDELKEEQDEQAQEASSQAVAVDNARQGLHGQ